MLVVAVDGCQDLRTGDGAGHALEVHQCVPDALDRCRHASAAHPLAGVRGPMGKAQLLAYPWFTGPAGVEDCTEEGRWLSGLAAVPDMVQLSTTAEATAAMLAQSWFRGLARRGSKVHVALWS